MAGHDSDDSSTIESVVEKIEHKISEKIHHDSSSSSSSDSDDDNHNPASSAAFFKPKIYRLFGRETPIHKLLGGGKPADVFLWRDKKVSSSVLGTATALWILFELLGYHLLTLVCHISIFSIAALFLWSNASIFIKKSPPQIPHIELPERPVLEFASALRVEVNEAFSFLHDVASGKDLKRFSSVIFGLWMLSIVGSSCNFITLFYIAVVLLLTVPVVYEKYEDEIDSFAEKAAAEIKGQYALFDAKVLSKVMSKVSRGLSKYKKAA